ncbi:MAG: ribosome maturation factor RimP [Candidatus Cloacimonas sp.]|nr:ribosome maturation factor RimP [Candidatus Cloacimonadota bacterium]
MVLERIEELARSIAKGFGLALYEIEFKNSGMGKVLRVFITSPDGVQVEDCSNMSRALGDELDVLDLIPTKYYLEVSSPGLERSLKRVEHYEQAIGQKVKVTYREEEKNATLQGVLERVHSDRIELSLAKKKKEEESRVVEIPYEKIKKARTVYEYQRRKKE